jgi:hypothetical protein
METAEQVEIIQVYIWVALSTRSRIVGRVEIEETIPSVVLEAQGDAALLRAGLEVVAGTGLVEDKRVVTPIVQVPVVVEVLESLLRMAWNPHISAPPDLTSRP